MRKAPQHAAGISALTVGKPDPKVLQDFLALKFALSRRTAKAMIDGRSVWVNRKCVWIARFALRTGDTVEVPSNVVKAAQKQAGVKEDVRRETSDVFVELIRFVRPERKFDSVADLQRQIAADCASCSAE